MGAPLIPHEFMNARSVSVVGSATSGKSAPGKGSIAFATLVILSTHRSARVRSSAASAEARR